MLVEEWVGLTREPKRQACWLQVMSHLSPRYGGIAASVPGFARATEAASAHACPIVGFCEREELDQLPEEQRAGITVLPPDRLRWMVDTRLHKRLDKEVRGATGVHIHGLWETHCMMAARKARALKRPYIISAHGMLEQWALRHKRLKKALYAALIEIRAMKSAACLRALSADEVDDYRRLGSPTRSPSCQGPSTRNPLSVPIYSAASILSSTASGSCSFWGEFTRRKVCTCC